MRNLKHAASALFILALAAAAVSCQDGAKTDVQSGESGALTAGEQSSDLVQMETDARLPLGLPEELSFEGETFTFLGVGTEEHQGYYSTTDLYAESENAEPLNDAVYKRNRAMFDLLGVTVEVVDKNPTMTEIQKVVEANDCMYDAVWSYGNSMYNGAAKGYFLDFQQIPYITLSNPWWDQNIRENFSFNDKNYIMTGDISTRDDACTFNVYFNKKLLSDFDLESPYPLVKEGTWTLDKFQEMVRAVSVDVNGDGVMEDGDQFGMMSENGLANRLFISAGGTYYTKNSAGEYEINITSERNLHIFDAVFTLLLDGNTVPRIEKWLNKVPGGNVYGYARSLFAQDKFLFSIGGPLVIGEFRNMESDFGIVPIPKFDIEDDRYYAAVDEFAPLLAVTVNAPNIEKTGAVLEAMSWESMYTVTPVYQETLLERKYTRDTESADMLGIIAESRVYNIIGMTNWGGLYSVAQNAYGADRAVTVSAFEKKLNAAKKALEKDLSTFEALD